MKGHQRQNRFLSRKYRRHYQARLRTFRSIIRLDCSHLWFLKSDLSLEQQLDAFEVLEFLHTNRIHRELDIRIIPEAELQLSRIIHACRRCLKRQQFTVIPFNDHQRNRQ